MRFVICYMSIKCSNIFPAFEIHMKILQKIFFLQNHNRERDWVRVNIWISFCVLFRMKAMTVLSNCMKIFLKRHSKLFFVKFEQFWSTMTSYRMFLTNFWHFLLFTSSATGFYASMPSRNPFQDFFCLSSLADNVLVGLKKINLKNN